MAITSFYAKGYYFLTNQYVLYFLKERIAKSAKKGRNWNNIRK